MLKVLTSARKWGVSLLGGAAVVLAANGELIPERYRPWAVAVVALATALGVYAAPNRPAPPG